MSHFAEQDLVNLASALLVGAGMEEGPARVVAEALVESDARGTPSHGLMLLPMYVGRIRSGSVTTRTAATTVIDHGAIAVLDAGHALGVLTADQAMELAIAKARTFGVGAVGVRHAFHFGGAYRYVRRAVDAGQIGLAAANTRPLMPAPGGATAVVGNNPLAVGVPGSDPVIVDMALSAAALGKIRLAEAAGREIPTDWATDAQGRPTSDPSEAIAGLLLPAGGHKGYALALVVDVLTGVLSGGASGSDVQGLYADVTRPNDCSHFFLALDPECWGGLDGFRSRADHLVRETRASALAPGVEKVHLPGEIEHRTWRSSRESAVPLATGTVDALSALAGEVGVDITFEPHAAGGAA